ncbi:unnamed protein product, partial [Polarella glacialis]
LRRDTGSRWQDALFSLFSLSAESLEPTLVTFNAAAGVCRPEVGGRAWAWACHLLFGKARHAGLGGPDQAGLNTALSAYSTGRCWAHALELLCRWPLEEAEANVRSFGAAIAACAQGGQWPWALELLHSTRFCRVLPNVDECWCY